jgi:hypothetical protein
MGAYFMKAPEHVYLHAGTRIGAHAFGTNGNPFDPKTLPEAFKYLSPAEFEDCLCIYKDEFLGVDSHNRIKAAAALDVMWQGDGDAV